MTWAQIAERIGQSKEWTTAAMLGQMTLTAKQAAAAQELFELTDEETLWLQIVPYKGSLPTPVPTDPLIYRWYEIVSVYGSTIKELIHE
ncbi:cyanase, partial [Escherichia coli]